MDPKIWGTKSHVIPASHVRGYSRGVRNQKTDRLRLSVNQYTPRRSRPAPDDAISIVFIHGVGSTKESYEPFFACLWDAGLSIRSIWAADIAWHGQSYLLNEDVIGDEPHWDDTARDTLQLVNHFQDEMPPPIVAIGQSWGGYPVIQTALMHPKLFAALVALEPYVVGGGASGGSNDFARITTLSMAKRRDTWKSREEARKAFQKNPYYAAFHPDVFEKVIERDLRDVSDKATPWQPTSSTACPVTLTTPKAMEVATMMRLNPENRSSGDDDSDFDPENGCQIIMDNFHRVEPAILQERLSKVRPPTLYLLGTKSPLFHNRSYRDYMVNSTGAGKGGSGGNAKNAVTSADVEGSGHPMPFEKPKETAEVIVPWLQEQLRKWEAQESAGKSQFWTKSLNPIWMEKLSKI